MPRATSSGTTNRSDSRMGFYIPTYRNEFRDFAGARHTNFEYWTAPYQRRGEPMRVVSRSLAMLAALLVLSVSIASAQHPQTRKGFWIGFGLGYGSLSC